MVTKNVPKPQAATRPRAATKTARRPAELDVDQRRQLEEAIRERQRNASAWEHQTREKLEEEETKKLLKSLKSKGRVKGKDKKKNKKTGDCGEKNPCGKKKMRMDMELLAEKVFQRLIFEARIERERTGWSG